MKKVFLLVSLFCFQIAKAQEKEGPITFLGQIEGTYTTTLSYQAWINYQPVKLLDLDLRRNMDGENSITANIGPAVGSSVAGKFVPCFSVGYLTEEKKNYLGLGIIVLLNAPFERIGNETEFYFKNLWTQKKRLPDEADISRMIMNFETVFGNKLKIGPAIEYVEQRNIFGPARGGLSREDTRETTTDFRVGARLWYEINDFFRITLLPAIFRDNGDKRFSIGGGIRIQLQ